MIIDEETLMRIQALFASLNHFRECAQVVPFYVEVIRNENGQIARVVILCPHLSLAYQLVAFLDAASFLWVSINGNNVIIEGLFIKE